MVVTRNSRAGKGRGKKNDENVVETAEVMETSEETKKDNEEAMEAEDEKADVEKDDDSEAENENKKLKRKIDSNGTAAGAKKFKGEDGEQVVEDEAEDEDEVSEKEIEQAGQKEEEFSIFMTRFAGKWVKVESVPLLEKFKSDAQNETNKRKKWKLEKIYKNALKNAEKKLAWEQKQRRIHFPYQEKEDRVATPNEIAPIDLTKFKISQKARNKLLKMRAKLKRQRKKLPERNMILRRMALKAEKSKVRVKMLLEKKNMGKNNDISMDLIKECM